MRNQIGLGVLGTAGLGAGLMFLLDPDMGGRRRAILRDKLISLGRLAAWAADKTSRDVKNRFYGTVASTKSRFTDEDVSDDVLVERVRSQMGRAVSHPHAISVTARDGRVTLSGEILSEEVDELIRSVKAVKGVKDIDKQLSAHDEPGDISSLQGGRSRRGSRFALLQSNWPPAIRLMVATSGVTAAAAGIKRGGIVGSIIGAIGTGMIIAAVTKRGLHEMVNRVSTAPAESAARMLNFRTRQRKAG